MNFECTYIVAYVVNLRSGDFTEGVASTVGILEVMQMLEGILEVRGVPRESKRESERRSFLVVSGYIFFVPLMCNS